MLKYGFKNEKFIQKQQEAYSEENSSKIWANYLFHRIKTLNRNQIVLSEMNNLICQIKSRVETLTTELVRQKPVLKKNVSNTKPNWIKQYRVQEFCDINKWTNIYVLGFLGDMERETGLEDLFQ